LRQLDTANIGNWIFLSLDGQLKSGVALIFIKGSNAGFQLAQTTFP
jgi:hypothetical protein